LIGDPSKAKKVLGWEAKVDLNELVEEMIKYDLEHE
jgi:GDPmannose 4,6-dehydratase